MTNTASPLARRRRFSWADRWHQARWALHGVVRFITRPVSRQTFTALSEALVHFRATDQSVAFMLQDPRVATLCRERYQGCVYVPEELVKHSPGSLGHEFGKAMLEQRFDPAFYRDYYGKGPYQFDTDEQYLRFRIRQLHDLVHVLTGFGANDVPEELGMQAFNAAQTRRPFSLALVGFGLLRIVLRPDELAHTLRQIAKGLAIGYAADQLLAHRYEDHWERPLSEWRRILRLTPEGCFEFHPPCVQVATDERSRQTDVVQCSANADVARAAASEQQRS